MEATNQGTTTDSRMGENLVVESGDQFTSYVTPLVQQYPTTDTSFHSSMECRNDVINEAEYGPDAPFWRTSMGKSIFGY